ncbi:OLC1v1001187C1 [Oldenlandia corymbosa var. corymbosa]|uniref:OLC1v1001187C1 n=1 Tax=Oldenlandia corymbosa var. corymbosa TaxID=529605 RepID=A0AAV1D4N9_OLDCO|nr:OLC1v1001187C1 [Oldenlandia corymbosa var. corymbosa]
MAGAQPPVEHPAPPRSFASFFQKPADVASNKTLLINQVKFINGTPTLEFEDDEFEQLIAPHRLCLVGKFSYGRPKMEEIHNEFKKIEFNGGYTLEVIYLMATALGQPLKVDTPTMNMTRPSVARFCVEVDLTKELPKSVKICKKGCKHEQFFTFKHISSYCLRCSKIGHKEADCRVGKHLKPKNGDEKHVATAAKKKGLEIKAAKPKWLLKVGESKNDALEVEILNMNPLVVKGFGKVDAAQTDAGRIAELQLEGETLAARLGACPAEETLTMNSLLAHPADQSSLVREETVNVTAMLPIQSEKILDTSRLGRR